MHIEPISAADFFMHPDARSLLDAYARECANEGLPPYNPARDLYVAIEQAGALHTFCALVQGQIVGFITVLVNLNPHYSQLLAVTESWFVAPEHRPTGAGLELYRHAKAKARELGAKALFVSAPIGGPLAGVMAGLGAAETNRVFCEVFG